MRFDEIDLIGNFKINGLIGESGKAIGFSGSNIEWIDAASGQSPVDALATSGYNYVIVEATGTPTENGQTLRDTINNITPLGTLTDNNRFQVLLMPGEYDMSGGGVIATSLDFVDIVGISSNPYDTIITHASNGAGFRITAYNQGWYNLYFKNCIIDEEGAATYLRWKNIVFGDDVFTSANALTNLIGEFEDITILGTCMFGLCTSTIDGIFNNINYVGVDSDAFFNCNGGSIIGTFSNIFANSVAADCFIGSSITGNFENITLAGGASPFNVFGALEGTFKNITIRLCSSAFLAESDAGSRFENIEIAEAPFGSVFDFTTFVTGTYKNITVGDVQGNAFRGQFDPVCRFENIKVGNIGAAAFASTDGNLDGTFKNIEIGSNSGCFFSTTENVYGDYKDITINGDVNGFISSTSPDGCVFFAFKNINVTLENLTITGTIDGSLLYQVDDTEDPDTKIIPSISGTYKNIEAKVINRSVFSCKDNGESFAIIDGLKYYSNNGGMFNFSMGTTAITASNIYFDTSVSIPMSEDAYIDITNMKGRESGTIGSGLPFKKACFRNIEINKMGSINTYYDTTNNSFLIKDFKIDNASDLFTGNIGSPVSGYFEDITIGSASNVFYASYSGGEISNLNVRNLNINQASNVFYARDTLFPNQINFTNSQFYNINIQRCIGDVFSGNLTNGMQYCVIENVYLGTASRILYINSNYELTFQSVIVRNLYAKSTLPALADSVYGLNILMKNCTIDFSDRDFGNVANFLESAGGIGRPSLERCKVISRSDRYVSTFRSGPIRYSAFNLLNNNQVNNQSASVFYNIIDSDLR